MIRDEFEILAAKVLADEAAPEEIARLRSILVENPELEAEFAELRATWSALQEAGPAAEAMDAPPINPPADRVKKWEATVSAKYGLPETEPLRSAQTVPDSSSFASRVVRHFAFSPWQAAIAASVVVAAIIGVVLLSRPPSHRPTGGPVAYLIKHQGIAEITPGRKMDAQGATTLHPTDTVHLSAEATATLICTNGAFSLKGPLKFNADQCPEQNKASTGIGTNGTVSTINLALFRASEQTTGLLLTTRSSHGIRVYSPAGFTTSLTPAILWKTEPGKTYDLSITDELAPNTPPLRHGAAVSPLQFTAAWPGRSLSKDGLYRLTVSETGKPLNATELVFRTQPTSSLGGASFGGASSTSPTSSTSPAQQLLLAYEILATTPSHLGDALAALLTLPPELANSEMALRLKLFAFGQLGCHEDFAATLSQLQR